MGVDKLKARIKRAEIKYAVLSHYGGGTCACVKCGYDDIRALSIDHIEGNGATHKKQARYGSIYPWLSENSFPEGFQTLCMNCQWVKKFAKDLPLANCKRMKNVAGRIRQWVNLRVGSFNAEEIRSSLGLTKEQGTNIRHEISRLYKNGAITKVCYGVYKNKPQSISVSRFRKLKIS